VRQLRGLFYPTADATVAPELSTRPWWLRSAPTFHSSSTVFQGLSGYKTQSTTGLQVIEVGFPVMFPTATNTLVSASEKQATSTTGPLLSHILGNSVSGKQRSWKLSVRHWGFSDQVCQKWSSLI
jgi:hypothetical protein